MPHGWDYMANISLWFYCVDVNFFIYFDVVLFVGFLYLHFSVLLVYCLSILIFVFLGFYLTEGKNIRLGR